MRRAFIAVTALGALVTVAASGGAQRQGAARPSGAFVGTINSATDSAPVRSADIRLFLLDSVRAVKDSAGGNSVEAFIDSTRSRLGVSDSSGLFAIWYLAPGRYMMNVRRIGFAPAEAIVTVDTSTVVYDFTMQPLSPMLARVEISASAPDRLGRRLDRIGFTTRSHFENGTFIKPADIAKRQALTLRDILEVYGLRETATYLFDRMPMDYTDIQDYPSR